MKNKYNLLFLGISLVSLFGCEKILMKPSPKTDNVSIFEEYWKIVDEKFSMFSDPNKKIDKENLYKTNRALVDNSISKDSLFSVLGYVVTALKDGHSYILNEDETRYKGYINIEGKNNLIQSVVDENYFTKASKTEGKVLKYEILKDINIGYIECRGFNDVINQDMMDVVLSDLKNTKGIILDVRGNTGGLTDSSVTMARHFTTTKVYVGHENFKTGPKPNDLSRSEIYLKPTDGVTYLKPLMVLIDRDCFSATSTLISHLNPLVNVTFVGAKTSGGSGYPTDGFLANGWYWSLSVSEFIDWEGRRLDNGFEPDIPVDLDDNFPEKDEIIERAIAEILK